VRGKETVEARDLGGLGGAEDTTELARVVEARRRGSGAAGGTSVHPNKTVRTAVSDGSEIDACDASSTSIDVDAAE